MANQETTHKLKACWTPEFHKLFVSLCLDQLLAGNKPGTYLNKKGWKYVMDEFYKRTGIMYDKKQFKNHWDSTKEQWKVWNKLKGSTTEDVWDKTTQMVKQNDEWWNDYLQAHPEAAQFHYRGLPLADSLDTIFSDSSASMTTAVTPLQNSMSNFDNTPPQAANATENNDAEDVLDLIPEAQMENKESPNISQAEFDTSVQRKRKSQDPERFIHGLKRESTSAMVARRLGHLCEAVESGSTVTSTLKERRIAIIKSNKDNRYGLDSIVTHDGMKMPCWALPDLSTFRATLGAETYDKVPNKREKEKKKMRKEGQQKVKPLHKAMGTA